MKTIILLALLTTACSTQQKQMDQMEKALDLCLMGAVKEYEGRTKESWIKLHCRG